MGFQILLSIFIVIGIIRLTVQFYKKQINSFFFIFFLLIWSVVLFFNWNNALLNKMGRVLGIDRGATVLVYAGLFLLFYHAFVSTIRFYELERNIDKLVRKDAVRDFVHRYGIKDE